MRMRETRESPDRLFSSDDIVTSQILVPYNPIRKETPMFTFPDQLPEKMPLDWLDKIQIGVPCDAHTIG